jgi:hypothetical protein
MVPIEQVLDNMSIGHPTGLYNSKQFRKWGFTKEQKTHYNSSNSSDHSEIDLNCVLKPSLDLESKMHSINIPEEDGGSPSSPQEAKPESDEHPGESRYGKEEKFQDPGIGGSLPVKVYPTKFRLVIILFALGLSMFLVGPLSQVVS